MSRTVTPEQQAVLAAIEQTGNPHDSDLAPVAVAEAMIWLEHRRQITTERLPVAWASRRAWVDYALRLHLEIPKGQPTIDDLRDLIGTQRLWTTHVQQTAETGAA